MTNQFLSEKTILNSALFKNYTELSVGQDDKSFNGFIVWSETATISFDKDPILASKSSTDFSEKTIAGDGAFYPLSGKNMLVTAGDVAINTRESE